MEDDTKITDPDDAMTSFAGQIDCKKLESASSLRTFFPSGTNLNIYVKKWDVDSSDFHIKLIDHLKEHLGIRYIHDPKIKLSVLVRGGVGIPIHFKKTPKTVRALFSWVRRNMIQHSDDEKKKSSPLKIAPDDQENILTEMDMSCATGESIDHYGGYYDYLCALSDRDSVSDEDRVDPYELYFDIPPCDFDPEEGGHKYKRWLLKHYYRSIFARALYPGVPIKTVITIGGPTNCGKTTFAKYGALPKHLRHLAANMNLKVFASTDSEKKYIESITGKLVMVIDEMSSTISIPANTLKEQLVRTELHARMAYAHMDDTATKNVGFAISGCFNNDPGSNIQVLPYDPVASARFAVLKVGMKKKDDGTSFHSTFMIDQIDRTQECVLKQEFDSFIADIRSYVEQSGVVDWRLHTGTKGESDYDALGGLQHPQAKRAMVSLVELPPEWVRPIQALENKEYQYKDQVTEFRYAVRDISNDLFDLCYINPPDFDLRNSERWIERGLRSDTGRSYCFKSGILKRYICKQGADSDRVSNAQSTKINDELRLAGWVVDRGVIRENGSPTSATRPPIYIRLVNTPNLFVSCDDRQMIRHLKDAYHLISTDRGYNDEFYGVFMRSLIRLKVVSHELASEVATDLLENDSDVRPPSTFEYVRFTTEAANEKYNTRASEGMVEYLYSLYAAGYYSGEDYEKALHGVLISWDGQIDLSEMKVQADTSDGLAGLL